MTTTADGSVDASEMDTLRFRIENLTTEHKRLEGDWDKYRRDLAAASDRQRREIEHLTLLVECKDNQLSLAQQNLEAWQRRVKKLQESLNKLRQLNRRPKFLIRQLWERLFC